MANNNDDINDIEDSSLGIELDKIVIPKVPETPAKAPIPEKPFETKPEKEPESKLKIKYSIIAVTAVCVLLLFTALFLFLKPKYHTYDPLITNLSKNSYINISFMIRYHHIREEEISSLEPVIRDSILVFLNAPDTKKMVNENELKKVEFYINKEIKNLLKNKYNGKVILKELKVYKSISPQ